MNNHVFVAYAYVVGTLVLIPITFFSKGSRVVPPLSFSILCKIVLLGAIGSSCQIMGYIAIDYSTPTLAAAIDSILISNNLLPSITFMFAVIFRMEKLAAKSRSSNAKVIGSMVSIAGAFMLTFYKGPSIMNSSSLHQPIGFLMSVNSSWAIAGIILIFDYFFVSLWYILMGILKVLMGGIVHAWSLRLKGAVYVTSFKPLQIVISVALGVIFLSDTLHVGSVIGATIISIGLYAVLWGKATEETKDVGSLESPSTENALCCKVVELKILKRKQMELFEDIIIKSLLEPYKESYDMFVVIIGFEFIDMGLLTLFKAATLQGMNNHVFIAYAYVVGTSVLLPVTLFTRRSRVVPPLNFSIIWKSVLLGAIGCASQILGYIGINYSSPTLASAIANLVPAFTFMLAVTFRMEKLAAKSRSSNAKVIGSIVSIAGAFVLTFYKGPSIMNSSSLHQPIDFLKSVNSSWAIAGIILTADYFLLSLWYILQVHILKEFPDELTLVLLYSITATIISIVVALLSVPDASAWKIGLNLSLISIVSSGIFGKLIGNIIYAWSVHLKGAVYVTSFMPFQIVISVGLGVIFLGDSLHIGSIIGATIISIGLYGVLWGKATEEIEEDVGSLESSFIENAPLLQSFEFIDMGLLTLFKAATLQGMNNHVFVAYAYAVATSVLLLVTLFTRRSRVVPPLSFTIICKIVLLGAIGCSSQILGYIGINYSSPTLASAISNLVPAFTFMLAVTFRMEKLGAKSRSSNAKVIGSIISIAGAFVLTFYKGPSIMNSSSLHQPIDFLKSVDSSWIVAGILLTVVNSTNNSHQ
ncbi:WAT1-related protein [Trifolium repens]|nr:WAT1-related protein [Trifolium repens]